jgi:peptide/nickel transport system substrate-binding protein
MEASDNYYAGRPKLDRFVVHSFRSKDRLVDSFKKQEVNAVVGLTSVPKDLNDKDIWVYNMPLTAAVMTFFKESDGVLADVNVRKALIQAADPAEIIKHLDYPAMPVREPLLSGQVGYNAGYAQAPYNVSAANATLDALGWKVGGDGVRRKDGQKLSFALTVQQGSEYATIAQILKRQWRVVGADVRVDAQDSTQFQNTLTAHDYNALLHGISIGKDPDVYVYWDSKQADPLSASRLNFSEFKSGAADDALQAGRTRFDPVLRAVKYQPFLQAWQADAPALGLYQPRFLYITRNEVHGLTEHPVNTDVERYTSVNNWMIRTAGVSQTSKDE